MYLLHRLISGRFSSLSTRSVFALGFRSLPVQSTLQASCRRQTDVMHKLEFEVYIRCVVGTTLKRSMNYGMVCMACGVWSTNSNVVICVINLCIRVNVMMTYTLSWYANHYYFYKGNFSLRFSKNLSQKILSKCFLVIHAQWCLFCWKR